MIGNRLSVDCVWGTRPMAVEEEGFLPIWSLIGAYFHQDMNMEYDSIPEAVAGFSRETDNAEKHALRLSLDEFLRHYHNSAEKEFARRWGAHFAPNAIDQSVSEFLDMVRAILADPESYRGYEQGAYLMNKLPRI